MNRALRRLAPATVTLVAAALVWTACEEPFRTAEALDPSALVVTAGDDQTGTVGQALATAITVRVDNPNGPAADVAVVFEATPGSGALSASTVRTNEAGQAQVTWTLGTAAGSHEVVIRVAGLTEQMVVATANAGPAALIDLSDAHLAFDALHDAAAVSAVTRDQYGNPTTGTPSWSTGQAGIATVVGSGSTATIEAVGVGATSVTASVGAVEAAIGVTVTQRVASVEVTPDASAFGSLGGTVQLEVEIEDANGNAIAVNDTLWTSSAPAVASVDSSGLVTVHANGSADIDVTVQGVSGDATITVAQVVDALTLSPVEETLGAVGDSVLVEADARDAAGNAVLPPDLAITWTVLDADVATRTAEGYIRALTRGTARVEAASGSVADTSVILIDPLVQVIDLADAVLQFGAIDDTDQIEATPRDANGNPVAGALETYTSADEGVATVDENGLVTATGSGATVVTVASEGQTADVGIVVQQVLTSLTIVDPLDTIPALHDTVQFVAAGLDANGHALPTAVPVSWSSENAVVATVDATGRVAAQSLGSTRIFASSSGHGDTVTVVVDPRVVSIVVSPDTAVIASLQDTLRFSAALHDANGNTLTHLDPSWSTSSGAVASMVDADGLVAAQAEGSSDVVASVGDVSGTAVVEVDQLAVSMQIAEPLDTVWSLGDTLAFEVEAFDALGNALADPQPAWAVLAGPALIDETGVALSLAFGVAEITAGIDGLLDTATVVVMQPSVADARIMPDRRLTVDGIVSVLPDRVAPGMFYIQDSTGFGLPVTAPPPVGSPSVAVGDSLRVTGYRSEFEGAPSLESVAWARSASGITPAVTPIASDGLNAGVSQGHLVTLSDVTVDEITTADGDVTLVVSDALGSARVHVDDGSDVPLAMLRLGSVYTIRGVAGIRGGHHVVLPRRTIDVTRIPDEVRIDSVVPAQGGPGDRIVIHGQGLAQPILDTGVWVGGASYGGLTEFVEADSIAVTVVGAGPAEVLSVIVAVAGGAADTTTWTFTGEPVENDDPTTGGIAQPVSLPFTASGFIGGHDLDDYYQFEVTEAGTITADLDHSPNADIDVLFTTGAGAELACYQGATGNRPEHAECALPAPGIYRIRVNVFDSPGHSEYDLVVSGLGGTFDIATARTLPDSTSVTVEGVVTAGTGTYNPGSLYVQDPTGGIMVFHRESTPGFATGDSIRVSGMLGTFMAERELVDITFVDLGTGTVPSPVSISAAELNAGEHQGELVVADSVQVVSVLAGAGGDVTVVAADGTGEMTIFGDDDTGLSEADFTVNASYVVTGIAVSFNDLREIKPRGPGDLAAAFEGLEIRLSVPATTPDNVHIAGDFNAWEAGLPEYRLTRVSDELYTILLPGTVRGPIEYKFTLGSWSTGEVDGDGLDTDNRLFDVPATGGITSVESVVDWREPPTADFTVGCTGLNCSMVDGSAGPAQRAGSTIVSWSWDFGDGNSSTLQNPDHTYATAGSYTITLTVTDDFGVTDSHSEEVHL